MRDTKFSFPPVPPSSSSSPASVEAAAEPSPKRRRVGEATEPAAEMREEALERLRGVVRDSVGKHLYASAIFLADKVAAATGDPADVYMLAQALFLGRHYRRALHTLNNSRLLRDLRFRFLAAKCLEELKEWHQCLLMLGDAKVDEHGNLLDQDDGSDIYFDKDAEDHEINIKAAICFLRGKAYEALDNRDLARQWYKAAIKADPLCYEALECLVDNYMLTFEEESELLSSLQFGKEDGWLSAFYSCLIRKHEKESVVEEKFKKFEQESCSISSSSSGENLKNNIDILACKAEYYHQNGEYQKCFELTSLLLERDPFHLKCTLVHLAAAMELGHSNDLYLLSCNLVKDYPQKALSWFAVGCYYYCIKKYDQARRYFGKATGLDGTFPPAWIGTGIAYAAQEEGDQAMAAFRTAARLFPGCHLPTLYMGMQYVRMHNFKLAEQVAVITPFNFPLEIPLLQVMGALYMGNKPVLKVDSKVSIVMDQMLRLLHACGLPVEDLDFINSDDGITMNKLLLEVVKEYSEDQLVLVLEACERMNAHLTAAVVSNNPLFLQEVLGRSVNGTTYAGIRARTTGTPQNHWFGPAGDPRALFGKPKTGEYSGLSPWLEAHADRNPGLIF